MFTIDQIQSRVLRRIALVGLAPLYITVNVLVRLVMFAQEFCRDLVATIVDIWRKP